MPEDTNRCRKRRRSRLRKLEGGVLGAVSWGCPGTVQVELCNQQCPQQLRQPPPGSLSELREEGAGHGQVQHPMWREVQRLQETQAGGHCR